MSKKLLALYGLKYNPFSQEIPTSALLATASVENFCWRIENQIGEGGFALITGAPGSGKSAALRMLADRLSDLGEVCVGILSRPQASVADFYREMGDLFNVSLTASNRWGGAKALRQKWQAHIDTSLYRPVLLVDEAQAMSPAVLCELRLLASTELDSRCILTVVFAGDERLSKKLQSDDLLPLASRIRCRLRCESRSAEDLKDCLQNLLKQAGNPKLMSAEVRSALSEHAAGNYRVLMTMANDLLAEALRRERDRIDEKFFFEVFDVSSVKSTGKRKTS
jgi:type II secretory pathway predicted ATPase ExeA